MIRSALFLVIIFGMGFGSLIQAQVTSDSTSIDSVKIGSLVVDSIPPPIPKQRIDEKKPERIVPWQQYKSLGMDAVTNDSLLRWQIWPNWGEFYAYNKDVISFRQGSTGRIDAFQISGFNPYEQSLSLEGIDLSNPITGLVNYNYVPHHKIGSMYEQKSGGYHSEIELKKYYILEPISYLNYDEAKYDYRNLEFMVTQNLSERTNIELSFWDRRDGGNYRRNDVLGNQIVARGYHYLSQNTQLRTIYLRNQFENQEPFGYQIGDPLAFSFDQFSSSPNVSNATSKATRRDWITGIYHRADSNSVEDVGLEIVLTKNEYNLPFTIDTLSWDLRNYSANAFKIIGSESISLKIEGGVGYHSFKENKNILESGWSDFNISSEISLKTISNLDMNGNASLVQRSDGFNGSEVGVGFNLFLFKSYTGVQLIFQVIQI